MCYLVAKNRNKHGCYALKTAHGLPLADLKAELNAQYQQYGIQLVTISRPSAYGEYAPYRFAADAQEFRQAIKGLVSCDNRE